MENDLANKLNIAVKFLKDGLTFKVDGYVLGMSNSDTVFVNGYSTFADIQNLSKGLATEEFIQMKATFMSLMNDATDFVNFMNHKTIEYSLVLDTGGGGIDICKEVNGVIEFFV